MRVRAVAVVAGLAAIGLSAGGCSYGWELTGGSDRTAEASAESGASLPPPRKVVGRARPVARPASTAELRWLGRFNRWWAGMTADLAFVANASDSILAGEAPSRPRGRSIDDVLDRLRQCKTELSREIDYPQSRRLRRLYALVADACFAVQRVAAGGSQILVHSADADAVTEWRGQWVDAEGLLIRAYRRLARFDPANEPLLPVQRGATYSSRIEPRFGKVASALARKRVRVRCWSQGDWPGLMRRERLYTGGAVTAETVGFASVGGEVVDLAPDVCTSLAALVYAGLQPAGGELRVYAALAVGTLAHESYHSRGLADESTTECYAVQSIVRTAHLLGVERRYGRELARAYWREVYRFEEPAYRTRACRSGGRLDLRPNRAAWP